MCLFLIRLEINRAIHYFFILLTKMYESESSRAEYSELDSSKNHMAHEHELKEQNEELLKENTVLRSQFEDALKITQQVEELNNKNRELTLALRAVRAEKDDLAHRLELSLQSNQEMNAKLNDEKRSCSNIRGTDLTSMTREIEKIKQQSKAQLDSIYDQLEKAKQATERESVEKRLLASKLDHILEDSQRYFQVEFKNIDDFMTFLSTPGNQSSAVPSISTTNQQQQAQIQAQKQQNTIDQLDRKLKHLKSKMKAAAASTAQLEEQLGKNQQEFNGERTKLKSQIKELEQIVHEERSEKKQISDQAGYQINALQQKNASQNKKIDLLNEQMKEIQNEIKDLRKENSELQKANTEMSLKLQFIQDNQTLNEAAPAPTDCQTHQAAANSQNVYGAKCCEVEETLLQRNDELQEELNSSNKKRDDLIRELQQRDETITTLHISIEKSKADYIALQHIHESNTQEIESLRNALHTREESEKEIQNKNKNAPHPPSRRILKLQKALDCEKQKVYELQNNENKLTTRIEDLETDLRLANQSVHEAEEERDRTRNELNEVRRQIENTRPLTADDLLPAQVFNCDEFDPNLSTAIVRIANNAALQPASKLQNCFKAIRTFYDKQLESRDSALDQAFTENQTLSNSFNQFLVDASIALNDSAVTLQDFFGSNAGSKLVDEIAQLRINHANLRHQYDILRGFISTFESTFGEYTSEQNINEQITEIRHLIESQKEAICVRSKKIHELKAIIRTLNATLKSKEAEYEAAIQELENKNEECDKRLLHLQGENKNLHERNDQLTTELETVTQEREQLETTMIQEENDQTQALVENFHKQEEQYKEELRTKNHEIHQLRTTITSYESEIQKQRQMITNLRSERQQREHELKELQRTLEEHDLAAAKRLEAEKQNITSTFENAVNELKQQCEKHRQDVQKMAVQVSETELKNAQLSQDIAQTRKDKRKIETELSSMKNTLDRERKLMESTIRAQKVQSEAQYNARLEEQRNKFDNEKRRLFSMGTETFRNLVNPSEQIDERSFRCVLEKARDTINTLSSSDNSIRRMLCVGEQQTTQDAVAQLLMMKGCTA